jgi:SpoVK/Ycf46/Vps4 family AAA+-type ATPase
VQLAPAALKQVLDVLKEHKHRERLRLHSLSPRSRLLFYGPPGCGKTVTARAIAGELGLPIFVVRFDALVGSYLGQTGLRLRELFRFAETNPCVLLIDEIDAIGRRRGRSTDIGELDRIVISLMQQIDLVQPAGVLIGASNLPEELDPALFRRFDMTLEFRKPSRKTLQEYGTRIASRNGLRLAPGTRTAIASSGSFADAERIVEAEHRRSVLQGL